MRNIQQPEPKRLRPSENPSRGRAQKEGRTGREYPRWLRIYLENARVAGCRIADGPQAVNAATVTAL